MRFDHRRPGLCNLENCHVDGSPDGQDKKADEEPLPGCNDEYSFRLQLEFVAPERASATVELLRRRISSRLRDLMSSRTAERFFFVRHRDPLTPSGSASHSLSAFSSFGQMLLPLPVSPLTGKLLIVAKHRVSFMPTIAGNECAKVDKQLPSFQARPGSRVSKPAAPSSPPPPPHAPERRKERMSMSGVPALALPPPPERSHWLPMSQVRR
ncbi:hypothetical protein LX32DRAFT_283953 [Colletotrichum zoysiae]|uniref:Uncharacterized protein n=1 Tax=Colletotrichum zoysiae TaxID=1216348 RepID=A0AAD9M6Z4_9PEZI|nr:hypothetical protein LX32DRAFT_283953 [Colletotrichum zoysiae]